MMQQPKLAIIIDTVLNGLSLIARLLYPEIRLVSDDTQLGDVA